MRRERIMLKRYTCVLATSTLLSSCAIHPLPEDVTGIKTEYLANHIRCEARYSISTAIGKYLSYFKADPVATLLSERLHSGEIYNPTADYRLDSSIKKNIDKYMKAVITYDFTFDMTETNNVSFNSNFLGVVTGGALNYAGAATNNLSRENNRNFFISDQFDRLLTDPKMGRYCADYVATTNFEYPISGTIGLEKPIESFVNLNEFEDLSSKPGSATAAPAMADTLKFTTAMSASLSPSVTILGAKVGLSAASLGPSVARTDMHQVIVALTLPVPKPAAKTGGHAEPASTTGKSSAAIRGEELIGQQRSNKFFDSNLLIVK